MTIPENPTILEVWAPWCAECKAMQPSVDSISAERFAVGLQLPRTREDWQAKRRAVDAVMAGIDDHMGACWEDAFRDHLRLRAAEIHPQTVAIGPWWCAGGQDEIDAVVLAGRERTPVLVGEATWARTVNGGRTAARLMAKARQITVDVEDLRLAICARAQVVDPPQGTLAVTAEDVFAAVQDASRT